MFHPLNSCEGGLHPDNGNWDRYLNKHDTDVAKLGNNGIWVHYRASNCHYLLHIPTGLVYSGVYGYHGYNLYNDFIDKPLDTLSGMLHTELLFGAIFPDSWLERLDQVDRILAIMYSYLGE